MRRKLCQAITVMPEKEALSLKGGASFVLFSEKHFLNTEILLTKKRTSAKIWNAVSKH